jgi:hypothetical protein
MTGRNVSHFLFATYPCKLQSSLTIREEDNTLPEGSAPGFATYDFGQRAGLGQREVERILLGRYSKAHESLYRLLKTTEILKSIRTTTTDS